MSAEQAANAVKLASLLASILSLQDKTAPPVSSRIVVSAAILDEFKAAVAENMPYFDKCRIQFEYAADTTGRYMIVHITVTRK